MRCSPAERIPRLTAVTGLAAVLLLAAPAAAFFDEPAWSRMSGEFFSEYGGAVHTAGDVNGDGYSDILVAAPGSDNGGPADRGRVSLYYGSPTGPGNVVWANNGLDEDDENGYAVAGGGDYNGDGYADFLVSRPGADSLATDAGEVWVWYGSSSGPSASQVILSNLAGGRYGEAVAYAGDVNGDGYDDALIGAPQYQSGRARLYFGSASGLSSSADWSGAASQSSERYGISVSGGADVNGDGYDDILVGAHLYNSTETDAGRVLCYLGGPAGPSTTPDWIFTGNEADGNLGRLVSLVGDMNGDGYADAAVGAFGEGNVRLFLGSATGLSPAVWWTFSPTGLAFGTSLAPAGDVNGDGNADVFFGDGDSPYAFLISGGEAPFPGPSEVPSGASAFGASASGAGDVDGDGFSDVLVGAPLTSDGMFGKGAAYLFLGRPDRTLQISHATIAAADSTDRTGQSVAADGDVNGDGLDDLLVGSPGHAGAMGRVDLYPGQVSLIDGTSAWTTTGLAPFDEHGYSVCYAGDVNGDGYNDVAVGAPGAEMVLVYHGGPAGPSPTPDFIHIGAPESRFGHAVSTAGDLNGDGYADLVVGAPWHSAGGPSRRGLVAVFLGSPTGLDPASYDPRDLGLEADANLGWAVAGPGDLDGDGFDDVAVGAPFADDFGYEDIGRVWILPGGPDGADTAQDILLGGSAGDQNGFALARGGWDQGGEPDLAVGSPGSSSDTGSVFVIRFVPPGWDFYSYSAVYPFDPGGRFGASITAAGDLDRDGTADLLVGAPTHFGVGSAWWVLGRSSPGPNHYLTGSSWGGEGGTGVGAGDLNGDGFVDLVMGAPLGSSPSAHLFYGNDLYLNLQLADLTDRRPRITMDDGTPIARRGRADAGGITFHARTRSAWGRTDVSLQVDVAAIEDAWAGPYGAGWVDSGPVGPDGTYDDTPHTLLVDEGYDYKWRMRFAARNPFVPRTPWFCDQPGLPEDKAFRVPSAATGVEVVTLPAGADRLDALHPNPFRQSSVASFSLSRRGHARLDVFDVTGRRIATLVDTVLDAGSHSATWDGRDGNGTPAATGVYFARLEVDGGVSSRKVVRVR